MLEPNDAEQAGVAVGRGGPNSWLGGWETGGERPAVSSRGKA